MATKNKAGCEEDDTDWAGRRIPPSPSLVDQLGPRADSVSAGRCFSRLAGFSRARRSQTWEGEEAGERARAPTDQGTRSIPPTAF